MKYGHGKKPLIFHFLAENICKGINKIKKKEFHGKSIKYAKAEAARFRKSKKTL